MPKSLINKYRDGLIIGSACEAGELYQALLDERSDETIANIVSFYDYLEIQPVGNNEFMIGSERVENVNSIEDIQKFNQKIVDLGEQFHKSHVLYYNRFLLMFCLNLGLPAGIYPDGSEKYFQSYH